MLIYAFWIFVIMMLLWQFYTYNQERARAAIEHPQQQHFWFTNSVATAPVAPAKAHVDGADVQQVSYSMEEDKPSAGSMTCHVTLKNMGNAKATGIQIYVRPFRGASNFNEDVGQKDKDIKVVGEDDPISKFGDWLNFPDLAPGESSTQSVVFMSRHYPTPGTNPNPAIHFQTEKAPRQAQPPPPHGAGG